MRSLVAPLLVAPLLALLPAGAALAAGACQGMPATIESSDLDITGTEGPDVILATRAAKVHALGGDDVICVYGGSVDAGAGNDSVAVLGYGGINIEDADLGPGVNRYTSQAQMLDFVTSGVPTEPNLDVIDTGGDSDTVRLLLAPGSHPQVRGSYISVASAPDDSAAWDVRLPGSISRAGVSMGAFTGVTSLDMDLGATVSLTVHGTDGPDDVTLGAGSVDADLGTGADRVRLDRFHTRPASGRIDFGSGKDKLSVDSLTPFSLDLRTGTTGGLGVVGLESSAIAAPKVLYRGSSHRDTVQAIGCRVVLRGGGGNDILAYANEDVRPSTPKCHGYRFRIFGQAGNDQMTGWRGRDLLVGGPGRDHANGKQDVDTCRAEVRVQCER